MPSERDRRANLAARGSRCERGHSRITGFTGPASRRRDLGGAERLVLPCNFLLNRSRCGGDLLAETEARAVDPHSMQDGGELAGECHLGSLDAATPATSSAHRFKVENRLARVSITLAAS